MEIVAQIAPVERDSHGLIAFICSGCGSADSILIDARAWHAKDSDAERSLPTATHIARAFDSTPFIKRFFLAAAKRIALPFRVIGRGEWQ